jgi:hypothetical protein
MAFAVVFDANVLYPISLTDFFLTLAGYGLYRPHYMSAALKIEIQLIDLLQDVDVELRFFARPAGSNSVRDRPLNWRW